MTLIDNGDGTALLSDVVDNNDGTAGPQTGTFTDDYQFFINWAPVTLFGKGQSVVVEKFDPGTITHRHQDIPAPQVDAMLFGVDLQTPPLWTLSLYTNCTNVTDALDALDPLAQVWNDPAIRSTPGQLVELYYRLAGRVRLAYGRPRKFTPVMTAPTQGRIDVVADFQLAENIFYSDSTESVTVGINKSTITGTGFTYPVIFPLYCATTPIARTAQAIIGGTTNTWVTVTITGPVSNPWVQIGDQRFALTGSVAQGETITLTPTPWNRGVYSSTGVYKPQMLDPRSRLSQLRFTPGIYTVEYGGFSDDGRSQATVSWRSAFPSL